jgi:putative secretion ATPase (PEP-CTERM system associated)
MYEAFYGFREKPFSVLPDPTFLYPSRKHRLALDLLEYGMMNQAGFNVITGEIGTGKTTLVRYLLNRLERDVTVGLISNTHRSFGELLQWILFAFELEHRGKEKVEMFRDFVDFLVEQYARNRRTLLIVDEAQNMSTDTLEELRMLSNVNADKDPLLQLVLVGQAELRDTLQRPSMEQFAQRVVVDYHLEPLDREETRAYVRHRLAVAGGSDPRLFDDAACDAVHEHSAGVPRLINLLCDTALVYGFAARKGSVDAELVNEVARDRGKGGIFRSRAAQPAIAAAGEPLSRARAATSERQPEPAVQRRRSTVEQAVARLADAAERLPDVVHPVAGTVREVPNSMKAP